MVNSTIKDPIVIDRYNKHVAKCIRVAFALWCIGIIFFMVAVAAPFLIVGLSFFFGFALAMIFPFILGIAAIILGVAGLNLRTTVMPEKTSHIYIFIFTIVTGIIATILAIVG